MFPALLWPLGSFLDDVWLYLGTLRASPGSLFLVLEDTWRPDNLHGAPLRASLGPLQGNWLLGFPGVPLFSTMGGLHGTFVVS